MSASKESQRTDAVSLADEEAVKKVLIDSVLGLWDVVNNLTRLKPSHKDRYRVTIFGSARAKPGTAAYEETKRASKALAEMGCDIITGGGPGLMQAANAGVENAGEIHSMGIRVDLPFEQEVNPFVGQAYEHRTFFSRLHHFMIVSDAFVVVPGGIGTLLELSLAWQLLQVRKLYNTPLILVGKMWDELVEWGRRSMLRKSNELASEIDFTIPHCVNTMDECVELIRENRAAWLAAQTIK